MDWLSVGEFVVYGFVIMKLILPKPLKKPDCECGEGSFAACNNNFIPLEKCTNCGETREAYF